MTQLPVSNTPIFHKIYELFKLLHSYHGRIPKADRYTLWQRCENTTLILLETVIEAGHLHEKERLCALYKISDKLDLLKVLIRLAKDVRTIDQTQYLSIQTNIQEIGKMIGGWIKFAPH